MSYSVEHMTGIYNGKKYTRAILRAYDKLSVEEKEKINELSNPLMNRCKGMSREMAIECLGKLGIFLVRGKHALVE